MAKWSSQHNGKYPDPYSKIKLDEEKKVKKKKKKKDKDKNRDSILSSLDPNTNTKVNYFPIMLGAFTNHLHMSDHLFCGQYHQKKTHDALFILKHIPIDYNFFLLCYTIIMVNLRVEPWLMTKIQKYLC